jgi:monothiol glutaredoxin
MGIRSRIKKKLPIFGKRTVSPVTTAPVTSSDSGKQSDFVPEPYTPPTSPRGEKPAKEFIEAFLSENDIAIFMKGSPQSPSCGFSANASAILTSYNVPYAHFDVYLDQEVREGVKDHSQWPTLPQIYIGGEFIGGSDILTKMHQSGELKEEIDEMNSKKASEEIAD